jgi:hypothetical protein
MLWFPLPIVPPTASCSTLSRIGAIGQIEANVGSLTPPQENKKIETVSLHGIIFQK